MKILQYCCFQIHWTINPGCVDSSRWDCNQTLLLHVTAQGPNNTINFLWSFYSKPSFLLAVTEPDADLKVKWETLENSTEPSVLFSSTPEYSFGLVLNKVFMSVLNAYQELNIKFCLQIIEFYDPEDTANLSLANASLYMECEKFHWSMTSIKQDGNGLVVQMLGSKYDRSSKYGNISLTVVFYCSCYLVIFC